MWVVGGDDDDYHNSNLSTWFNWKQRIISKYSKLLQAVDGLSDDKMLEFREIFSFFDRSVSRPHGTR